MPIAPSMPRPVVPQGRWPSGPPAHVPHSGELYALLRCPVSRRPLGATADGDLQAGDRRYPVIDGVPILVGEGGITATEDYVAEHRAGPAPGPSARIGRFLRRAGRVGPAVTRNVGSAENYARLRELLLDRGRAEGRVPRALVIGGAVPGSGFDALLDGPGVEVIESDLVLGPRTTVVCDAHALPFADGAFDAVICQGVLSVVCDPQRVVAEIHRVLGPGGLVYSEVAFMQQVCNGAYDFTRWTPNGHARLYRDFDVLDAGASGGPGMALAWSLSYFAMSFTGHSHLAHGVMRRLVALLTFPLPWLDGYLARQPGGLDAAAGVYLIGSRRDQPRSDSAVVGDYAGAVRPAGGLIG